MKTLADYFKKAGIGVSAPWQSKLTLNPLKIPEPHQVDDLKFLGKFARAGLLHKPGAGKTLPVQAYGLWLAPLGNKVIYTMPPALMEQFKASFETNFPGFQKHCSLHIFDQSPKVREQHLTRWKKEGFPDFMVLSYVAFKQYHALLAKQGYSALVVDEATAVKHTSSNLHKCVRDFVGSTQNTNGLVLMTGTPVETNVEDCFALIHLLDPFIYGSRRAFDRAHCIKVTIPISKGNRVIEKITGYKNLDALHRNLYRYCRRVDVKTSEPYRVSEVPVTLSSAHRRLYHALVNERLAEIGDEVIDLTTQQSLYQALQKAIVDPSQYSEVPIESSLLNTLDTLIDSLEGRKVLVYAWHTDVVKLLAKRYEKLNPAMLFGETVGGKDSQRLKFVQDPTCRIMVANYKSGGVGVDELQTVCSHMIFAQYPQAPGLFQQAVGRLARKGQSERVTVYFPVVKGTLSVHFRNELLRRDELQEAVVLDKRALLKQLMGE